MLPKIDIPIYETNLISNGEVIRFRPFLVKEQKLFLMAGESDDPKETIKAIKQVLRNCILDDVDIENMATFDIEYLFLQLRARSVGEVANLRFTCNNNISETEKCGNNVKIDVNVLEINPEKNKDHSNKIPITDKVGIVLKYPTFNSLDISNLNTDNIEQILEIIVSCVDYIYDADNVYYAKDTPKQELVEFIENLKQADLEKVSTFFNTLPKVKKDVDFNCEKCGYKEVLTLEGIQSFFG
jgi:DNA-directed RNA polymerase subunit M/transcription elongation factor TFIIS